MKRTFRPRIRPSEVRNPKLIIIATEGDETEKQYFESMAMHRLFYNPHIHVEITKKQEGNSAPHKTLEQLDSFRRSYHLNRNDELWLVIDVDRWGDSKLSEVAQLCKQKNYYLAISNPCFEIWLLLHFKSVLDYDCDTQELILQNPKKNKNRTFLEAELINLLGGYNKSKLDFEKFAPYVLLAISRAKSLDTNPDDRWIQGLGTRVYRLVEALQERIAKQEI